MGSAGVRVIAGKEVIEVLPAGVEKGRAVEELRRRLAPGGATLYAGDDSTDEDVFARLEGEWAVGVVVGDGRGTRARYSLAGTADVEELIRRLTRLRRVWRVA